MSQVRRLNTCALLLKTAALIDTEARRLLALALEHPGANAEVKRFFVPLQETLVQDAAKAGESHSARSIPVEQRQPPDKGPPKSR